MNKACINKGCPLKDTLIIRTGAKYCSICGSELTENKACQYCEHEIFPTDKFCEFCGRPIK